MPSLTDELKGLYRQRWEEASGHPLTQDWNKGDLHPYIQYVYLDQEIKFSGSAFPLIRRAIELSKAYNDDATKILENQWDFLMNEEDPYWRESLVLLENKINDPVKIGELQNLELESVNKYLSFLDHQTSTANYVEIMVILFVMEEIYLDWGKKFLAIQDKLGVKLYDRWIELHSGEDFTKWCKFVQDEVNTKAEDSDKEKLKEVFFSTVNHEFSFFDDCYNTKK